MIGWRTGEPLLATFVAGIFHHKVLVYVGNVDDSPGAEFLRVIPNLALRLRM